MCFVTSPLLPPARRGTVWNGIAHSSDWYTTLVQGVAGGNIPNNTGPRDPDGVNLWPALVEGTTSPRTEVVHQVQNQHFSINGTSYVNGTAVSHGDCDGSCGISIRCVGLHVVACVLVCACMGLRGTRLRAATHIQGRVGILDGY